MRDEVILVNQHFQIHPSSLIPHPSQHPDQDLNPEPQVRTVG
jgi:hypothetical protein